MTTEHDIQQLILNRFRHEKYIVPNIHLRLGEADILLVRRSGYAEEFEIKLTKPDFRADAKKITKHTWYSQVFQDDNPLRCFGINRFSYVLPDSLGITADDVPDYAGLYHVRSGGGIVCIKHPPLIHKKKFEHWDREIAASCSARYMALRADSTRRAEQDRQTIDRLYKELESK